VIRKYSVSLLSGVHTDLCVKIPCEWPYLVWFFQQTDLYSPLAVNSNIPENRYTKLPRTEAHVKLQITIMLLSFYQWDDLDLLCFYLIFNVPAWT
jgi:hypothetical protein